MSNTSRSLRQEEIDSYNRQRFIDQVLAAIANGRKVRFLIHKRNYSLVEVQKRTTGEYEFQVADRSRYTYRMSDFIQFLETIYDSGAEIISLTGEAEITAERQTANADAEPDHDYEIAKRQEAQKGE